jgi:signal peptidase
MERWRVAPEITQGGRQGGECSKGHDAGRGLARVAVLLRRGVVVATYAFVAAIVAALLAVTLPAFVGFHSVIVYGGSMGAALPTGSVAVTRPVDASDLAVGDIIAIGHGSGGLPTLHRIVAVEDAGGGRQVVTTRGDANRTNDPQSITTRGSGDRVVFHVPLVGYLVAFTRTGVGVSILMLPVVARVFRGVFTAARVRREAPTVAS